MWGPDIVHNIGVSDAAGFPDGAERRFTNRGPPSRAERPLFVPPPRFDGAGFFSVKPSVALRGQRSHDLGPGYTSCQLQRQR